MNSQTSGTWSILRPNPEIQSTYRRIILVSAEQQLSDIDPQDLETLVVTTEWLVWWAWTAKGGHAVHTDQYIIDWDGDGFGDAKDICLAASDWVYADGRDQTLFLDVSIGHQFDHEIAAADYMFRRLYHALGAICRAFAPDEIVFRDLHAHLNILDDAVKRLLVAHVAGEIGIDLVDEFMPADPAAAFFQDAIVFAAAPPSESRLRGWLRTLFTWALEPVFKLRWHLRGQPKKIFFVLIEIGLRGMIEHGRTPSYAPVFIAGRSKKSLAFYRHCWRVGAIPAHFPSGRLSGGEKWRFRKIIESIEDRWRANPPQSPREEARRQYVRERLFRSGKFLAMARFIKRNVRLFEIHGFSHVVVSDATAPLSQVPAELAKSRGLGVDEMLNGIFVTPLKDSARCGDDVNLPLVDRNLAWGKAFKNWFPDISGTGRTEISGYPVIDHLRALAKLPSGKSPTSRPRALLLTIYSGIGDALALRSNTVAYAVEFAEILLNLGYDVQFRGHPGTDNAEFYAQLFPRLGLDVPVAAKGSSYRDQLTWADIVVGPVSSGAFVEALALGKPYIGVVPRPSSIDIDYFTDAVIVRNGEELRSVLNDGTLPDPDQLLATLCAVDDYPVAGDRLADILEATLGNAAGT